MSTPFTEKANEVLIGISKSVGLGYAPHIVHDENSPSAFFTIPIDVVRANKTATLSLVDEFCSKMGIAEDEAMIDDPDITDEELEEGEDEDSPECPKNAFYCVFDIPVRVVYPVKMNAPGGIYRASVAVKGTIFNEFKSGERKSEWRLYNPYFVKRLLPGITHIQIRRGMEKGDENRLVFKVDSVKVADYNRMECDPYNIPEDFIPRFIVVHLGERVE